MRIPEGVFEGLVEIYGHLDRRIWVYGNGFGSLQYLALRPDEVPPKKHPHRPSHTVMGWVDLSQPNADLDKTEEPPQEPSWPWLILKLIMGIVLISLGLFIAFVKMVVPKRTRP